MQLIIVLYYYNFSIHILQYLKRRGKEEEEISIAALIEIGAFLPHIRISETMSMHLSRS